jgi:hypothetical protein
MSRPWLAAALVATVASFATAYALASAGSSTRAADSETGESSLAMTAAASPPLTAADLGQRLPPLHPAPPPPAWKRLRVPGSPAILSFPASWRPIAGDPGTASAALRSGGRIGGYLNATPQGGGETLRNWLGFRPAHNRDEGDVEVMPWAGRRGMRFRGGSGSCLIDDYTTATGARYRELACIVAGRRATTVVVGSATRTAWPRLAPVLREAVSNFTT